MIFKSGGLSRIPTFDYSSLALFEKLTNMGVKIDPSLKLDCQVNFVVKSSVFQLHLDPHLYYLMSGLLELSSDWN